MAQAPSPSPATPVAMLQPTAPLPTPTMLPTKTPLPPTVTPVPVSVPVTVESLLKRQDLPPEGIVPQLPFGYSSAGSCSAASDLQQGREQQPRIAFFSSRAFDAVEIGAPATIARIGEVVQGLCLAWFAPDSFVAIEVTRPDGQIVHGTARPDQSGFVVWPWLSLPSDPVGAYTVVARQADREASGAFPVREASVPHVAVVPSVAPLGTSFQVVLAGFAPTTLVQPYLYRDGSFVAALPAVVADAQGNGQLMITSQADDPPGIYDLVVFDPEHRLDWLARSDFRLGVGQLLVGDALVSASSVLPPEQVPDIGIVHYDPVGALDFDRSTAWVEGVPGPGIGERLSLTFAQPVVLTNIEINSGFDRDDLIFRKNNRLRRASLIFADGQAVTLELSDRRGNQSFALNSITTTTLDLVIEDVYPGLLYDDTALATVHVYGYRVSP